jgi:hypothetical protein
MTYTFCNGCKHVSGRPRLRDYDIDEWRGECAKRHKVWAHKHEAGGINIFPVGQGVCPDLEVGGSERKLLCNTCKWTLPFEVNSIHMNLRSVCTKGHSRVAAASFFIDVPLESLIRENSDFCPDHDTGNHPTRFERILSDLL